MRVALSGLNNSDNPSPGVGVAKGILTEHQVIGLAYEASEPGIYQGLFEEVFLMPFPTVGKESFLERLAQVRERSGIEAVIPNLDAELPLYIKYQDEIRKLGIATFLPTLEQFESRDKSKLFALCEQLKVLHPKTIEVHTPQELAKEALQLGFPLMVKGKYYKAYKVTNLEDALEAFYKISNEWGLPILLQEVVDGSEINMVALSDGERVLGGVSIKKLMTTELGKVWSAVTIRNEELPRIAQQFVQITGFRGPFELECIAGKDGIYLIEINPRFPAWVHFATEVGINLPSMLVQLLEGKRPQSRWDYPTERMYVRYVEERVCAYRSFLDLLQKKELKDV